MIPVISAALAVIAGCFVLGGARRNIFFVYVGLALMLFGAFWLFMIWVHLPGLPYAAAAAKFLTPYLPKSIATNVQYQLALTLVAVEIVGGLAHWAGTAMLDRRGR